MVRRKKRHRSFDKQLKIIFKVLIEQLKQVIDGKNIKPSKYMFRSFLFVKRSREDFVVSWLFWNTQLI